MTLKILIVIMLTLTTPSIAITDRQFELANNLQEKMVTCASYFNAGAQCVGQADPVLRNGLLNVRNDLVIYAKNLGLKIGMSNDAMMSRQSMQISTMKRIIKGDCGNISSLQARYADMCTLDGLFPGK